MKTVVVMVEVCLIFTLFAYQEGVALTVPDKVHPAYKLVQIRPDDWKPPVTDVTFNSKGELMLTTYHIGTGHNYNMPGEVYLLKGTDGPDNSKVEVIEYANGFKDPMGLFLSNDSVYVVSRGAVTVLFDEDGDGKSDYRKVVYKIELYNERMWSYGPALNKDNSLVIMNSCHMTTSRATRGKSKSPMRGVIYTIDGAGNATVVAGGVRQPNGITETVKGEIFITDNQGEWLPACKLIHVKKGRYYGHPQIHLSATPWDKSIPESPPAVWLPYGEIGWSNTYPTFVKTGLYRGQVLCGDNNFGGIQRYFLERVKGEYQGVIFQFTGGLEVGMNSIEEGPDGSFYMGGIGDGARGRGAWGWNGKRFGLQKLVPNGKTAFEMLAIRSKADGFEIEFTKAPGAAAAQASNYALIKGGFKPGPEYGEGNMEGRAKVSVQSVTKVSDTRYHLVLGPEGLSHIPGLTLKSTAFHFKLSNITSAENEELWTNEAWYTLNNIGPAEKVGCMEKGKKGYDPTAVYDDGYRCGGDSAIAITPMMAAQSAPKMKQLGQNTLYYWSLADAPYFIKVADMNGRKIISLHDQGGHWNTLDMSQFKPGIYFASLNQGTYKIITKIIIQ